MASARTLPATALLLALTSAAVFSPPASAEIIFDQELDTTALGFVGLLSDTDSDNEISFYSQAADDFALVDGRNTVTGIHWWGTSNVPEDFVLVDRASSG